MSIMLLAAAGACSDGPDDVGRGSSSTAAPSRAYASGPTTECLERSGAVVGELQPEDVRLQALRDLEQRGSLGATFGRQTVGLAFVGDAAAAQTLAGLLEVPDDPYRIETDRNVVLMYKPLARQAFQSTVGCLSP